MYIDGERVDKNVHGDPEVAPPDYVASPVRLSKVGSHQDYAAPPAILATVSNDNRGPAQVIDSEHHLYGALLA